MVSAMLMPDGSILHSCKGIPPNPLFKHKYIFNVKKEALKNSTVKLNVWKIDKYSTRVPFGECALSLGDVFKDDSTEYIEDVWLEVQPKDQLVRNEILRYMLCKANSASCILRQGVTL